MAMEGELKQILEFLDLDQRSDVRGRTLEAILGLSKSPEQHPYFTKLAFGVKFIECLSDSEPNNRRLAASCLVSFSTNPNFSLSLSQMKSPSSTGSVFDYLVKMISKEETSDKDLLLTVLRNVTANVGLASNERCIAKLMGLDSVLEGLNIVRLCHMLGTRVNVSDVSTIVDYHNIPRILANVCSTEKGRALLMSPERSLLKRYVVPFLDNDFNYDSSTSMLSTHAAVDPAQRERSVELVSYYRVFHQAIWDTVHNCSFFLDDFGPFLQEYSERRQRDHLSGDTDGSGSMDDIKEDDSSSLSKYVGLIKSLDEFESEPGIQMAQFLSDEMELVYEVMNPLLSQLFAYKSSVRSGMSQSLQTSKYVRGGKSRFSDVHVRFKSLQILHGLVGSARLFKISGLCKWVQTRLIVDCQLSRVLKEYERWESDESSSSRDSSGKSKSSMECIDLSKRIRKQLTIIEGYSDETIITAEIKARNLLDQKLEEMYQERQRQRAWKEKRLAGSRSASGSSASSSDDDAKRAENGSEDEDDDETPPMVDLGFDDDSDSD